MAQAAEKQESSDIPRNTASHVTASQNAPPNPNQAKRFNHRSWRIDEDTSFWQTYITEAEKFDKEMVDGWNQSLDNLLVFSGLFSAVNTAFIIETYKSLRQDPADEIARMFRLLLKHRNDDYQFSDKELGFAFEGPERPAIRINSIFFASLSCSLLVALGAVQGKDWLTRYNHPGLASKPYSVQAHYRQKKLDGLERWGFRLLVRFLPFLMQLSLALFLAGVTLFLWEISKDVAVVVMGFALAGLLSYLVSFLISVCDPSAPFQTLLSDYSNERVLPFLSSVINSIIPTKDPTTWLETVWLGLSGHPSRKFRPNAGFAGFGRWEKIERIEEAGNSEEEKEIRSAECVGWLFEQAEQADVVLRTINVASLLPPNSILQAFNRRPGLVNRLATRYSSYVEERVWTEWRIAHSHTIITGIALFHILKARLFTGSDEAELSLSKHRIRSLEGCDKVNNHDAGAKQTNSDTEVSSHDSGAKPTNCDRNKSTSRVLEMVICCVEMLLPDSEGADVSAFEECFKYVSHPENFGSPVQIPMGPMQEIPNSTLTDLNVTVIPSGLLLDALISCAIRRIVDEKWGEGWYERYKVKEVLSCLRKELERERPQKLSEEMISHIAILVSVIQLARRPNAEDSEGGIYLEEIRKAWYVVDKRWVADMWQTLNTR
ncbi:hypothetical protein FRC02_001968 [Tulasnella sp. 418]|nr:hypothetical protein FRC02_001968 [Tulasnella sp. 418]